MILPSILCNKSNVFKHSLAHVNQSNETSELKQSHPPMLGYLKGLHDLNCAPLSLRHARAP